MRIRNEISRSQISLFFICVLFYILMFCFVCRDNFRKVVTFISTIRWDENRATYVLGISTGQQERETLEREDSGPFSVLDCLFWTTALVSEIRRFFIIFTLYTRIVGLAEGRTNNRIKNGNKKHLCGKNEPHNRFGISDNVHSCVYVIPTILLYVGPSRLFIIFVFGFSIRNKRHCCTRPKANGSGRKKKSLRVKRKYRPPRSYVQPARVRTSPWPAIIGCGTGVSEFPGWSLFWKTQKTAKEFRRDTKINFSNIRSSKVSRHGHDPRSAKIRQWRTISKCSFWVMSDWTIGQKVFGKRKKHVIRI